MSKSTIMLIVAVLAGYVVGIKFPALGAKVGL